jgi:hypothetical protein
MDATPIYLIWVDMRRRCNQSQRPDYHRYGGRGIKVCDRWNDSFEAFFADMGDRPEGLSLERRDNNGPYSPENCYWADRKTQMRNSRSNRYVEINGQRMVFAEACEKYGVNYYVAYQRWRRGLSLEKVFHAGYAAQSS